MSDNKTFKKKIGVGLASFLLLNSMAFAMAYIVKSKIGNQKQPTDAKIERLNEADEHAKWLTSQGIVVTPEKMNQLAKQIGKQRKFKTKIAAHSSSHSATSEGIRIITREPKAR